MQKEYRFASLNKRIPAKIIDCVIAILPNYLFPAFGLHGLWGVLAFCIGVCYFLFADSMGGRSIGKRIFGLKVVDYRHGSACKPLQALIRNGAGIGKLRFFQELEEQNERDMGTFMGTVVIDLAEPPESDEEEEALAQEPAKLRLDGVMDLMRGEDGEK